MKRKLQGPLRAFTLRRIPFLLVWAELRKKTRHTSKFLFSLKWTVQKKQKTLRTSHFEEAINNVAPTAKNYSQLVT